MRTTIICLAILCRSLTLNAGDLTILSKVRSDGGAPETTTSYISSDHLRIAQPDRNEVIIDLESGDMTVIDGTRHGTFLPATRRSTTP